MIHSLQVWFHYYYYYNLIPWCQFKEMDQGHEMSFLILNREVKRMVFCLNRMKVWRPFGNKPLPKLPFSVPPVPIPATPGNFNTIKLNISSTVIKFWLWQNYQIIQNNLPKLGTWILDLWNPHIMKFELIGSRNLHNKIKGNVSRQRAVHLVTYNYYNYCFYRTSAAALPGWWYCHSPVNKPPPSQTLSQDIHVL